MRAVPSRISDQAFLGALLPQGVAANRRHVLTYGAKLSRAELRVADSANSFGERRLEDILRILRMRHERPGELQCVPVPLIQHSHSRRIPDPLAAALHRRRHYRRNAADAAEAVSEDVETSPIPPNNRITPSTGTSDTRCPRSDHVYEP